MKLTPQQQLVAWIVGGTICIIVGMWFVLFPLRTSLQSKSAKILEARVNLEVNNRQQQNLTALKNQVDQILKNTETLNAAFFNRSETFTFLQYIENLADREGLKLAEPQLTAPARTSPDTPTTYSVEEQSFHFELQGAAPSLMHFLRTLETNPAYILIQTIDLRKGDVENENMLTLEGVIPWH